MLAGPALEPDASGEDGKEEAGEQSGKEERGDVLRKPQCQGRGTKP